MSTTSTPATWQTHRYPRSVYGPQGVSYYSADVSPTEYLTVKRDQGEWAWRIFTTRQHDPFGGALSLARGTESSLAKAKAAVLADWQARQSD